MLICMRMKRNASRMPDSTSCSSFLIGKTKEKPVFLLYFPHLFVSLHLKSNDEHQGVNKKHDIPLTR